jgi:hypothetical protein
MSGTESILDNCGTVLWGTPDRGGRVVAGCRGTFCIKLQQRDYSKSLGASLRFELANASEENPRLQGAEAWSENCSGAKGLEGSG